MGLLDKLFPNRKTTENMTAEYFKSLVAYSPSFTSYDGGLYEMDLTRSAIHTYAKHCAKLKPEISGSAYKSLEKTLQYRPNPYMDTYKFLYKIATSLKVENTAFIIPLHADDGETIIGLYPLRPDAVEMVEFRGEPWLRYRFANGQRASMPFAEVGVMTNHQWSDDIFGSNNRALSPTLDLLNIQTQGMQEAVRQSAMLRFMAKVGRNLRPEDIKAEREQFSEQNLSSENQSGVMMFDAKYADVRQIDSKPYVIDNEQMSLIHDNVFNYIGVNKDLIQNNYTEDQFNSFYEGEVEPFAIQLSLVVSNMLFTPKEMAFNNAVTFTANRLQYASNKTKLDVSMAMFDRGLFTENQIMDIWNMPHVEGGDQRRIRGEYVDLDEDGNKTKNVSVKRETDDPVDANPDKELEKDGADEDAN